MFLVAVTGNGTVFLIRGASDSRKQVEQLTKQEGIRLTDVGLARSYAEFYLEVNPDNLSMNYVGSPDQLKFNAKEEFHIVLGEREWRKAFNEWWNDYALKYTKQDFNMQVKKNGPVFSVTFSVLSSFGSKPPKAPPRVLRALLILSSHGDVQGPRFRPAALPRH
jgi:hypothetical protein